MLRITTKYRQVSKVDATSTSILFKAINVCRKYLVTPVKYNNGDIGILGVWYLYLLIILDANFILSMRSILVNQIQLPHYIIYLIKSFRFLRRSDGTTYEFNGPMRTHACVMSHVTKLQKAVMQRSFILGLGSLGFNPIESEHVQLQIKTQLDGLLVCKNEEQISAYIVAQLQSLSRFSFEHGKMTASVSSLASVTTEFNANEVSDKTPLNARSYRRVGDFIVCNTEAISDLNLFAAALFVDEYFTTLGGKDYELTAPGPHECVYQFPFDVHTFEELFFRFIRSCNAGPIQTQTVSTTTPNPRGRNTKRRTGAWNSAPATDVPKGAQSMSTLSAMQSSLTKLGYSVSYMSQKGIPVIVGFATKQEQEEFLNRNDWLRGSIV